MTAGPDATPAGSVGNAAPTRRRRLFALGVAGVFGLAGAGVAWLRSSASAANDAAVATLMSLSLPDARATMVPLANFRGKTLVVNFWATWCAPCIEEMPQLSELNREFITANAQAIGIGIDSAANVSAFALKNQLTYPLLAAGSGGLDLLTRFGDITGVLPYTVVIDGAGRVVERITGRFDRTQLRALTLKTAGKPG
jgi:peroxiredoxin